MTTLSPYLVLLVSKTALIYAGCIQHHGDRNVPHTIRHVSSTTINLTVLTLSQLEETQKGPL